ncbi:MAG TPA: HAD-IC family P-type ATPase [Anaerolineaceae bacterium]|nr:HAD-IC family P-type ATPase [Anaerolineaceae bacterium]
METKTEQPVKAPPAFTGLSDAEAESRRAQGLGNRATIPSSRTYWQIFKENAFTFVNIVLFGLGIILILLGRVSDALVSVGVISINMIVSIVQEIHAKQTLDHISLITRPAVTVVREGMLKKVDLEAIVAGDVLLVETGDQVVADGALLSEDAIQVDESQLTGESNPITKHTADPLYSGSFCLSGSGYYQAEKVGSESLTNRLTTSARTFRRVKTPLQKEVNLVVRVLLLVAGYLEILLIVNSLFEKIPLVESVRMSVVVLGLIPNGLFLAIATSYAMGAVRIASKGALVQQSNAIESLSHVNVLCLDKTGTLTTNRLKVNHLVPVQTADDIFRCALGDFTASFQSRNQTTAAISEACPGSAQPTLESVPFSSTYRWSGLAMNSGVYILGAPETVLAALEQQDSLLPTIEEWTQQGLRVLVFAHSPNVVPLHDVHDAPVLPAGLVPLGLIALADELRPEARETLENFRKAGVEPKIFSGDNPDTVAALAKQAGFDPQSEAVSGIELARMKPEQVSQALANQSIFGRIAPQQKEQMVHILRDQGKYVAMIGDGVNDVLALKGADLAIAMQSGSQAARAVSDIVLLDDSFGVLPQAVLEGQRILNGMQDTFKLFLTRILYVVLLILSSAAIGGFPLTPKHNSILTFLTVGLPTIALAAWAKPGAVPQTNALRRISHFVLPAGLALGLAGMGVFIGFLIMPAVLSGHFSLSNSIEVDLGSIGLNIAQTALTSFSIFCGLFLILFVEPPSEFWVGGTSLRADPRSYYLAGGLCAIFVLILVTPPLRNFFELAPLAWFTYLLLFGLASLWALLVRWLWRSQALDRYLSLE